MLRAPADICQKLLQAANVPFRAEQLARAEHFSRGSLSTDERAHDKPSVEGCSVTDATV